MVTKNTIEYVCSHNHGRSPLAQAFSLSYLSALGNTFFNVISSGSKVDKTNSMLDGSLEIPPDFVKWLLNKGLERGLFDKHNEKFVRTFADIETDNVNLLRCQQNYSRNLHRRFVAEEHEYRAMAFKRFRLGTPKEKHDQTVGRNDTFLVLGMGVENVDKSREIYINDGIIELPEFETLAGHSLEEPGRKFKSGFGGDYNDYLNMAEEIRELVFRGINRLI
ncbi:hypothetical protein GOV12_07465 [Candidatus Pacearchaeota archaeon]|nr:hypothetical protein [Candidatus Pacearchaeota archaeon]